VIRGNLIVLPLNGNQLIAIEPVYVEAEQTKIPTLARIVLAQLLPDDRKIEWAKSLKDAEDLLVGPCRSNVSYAAEGMDVDRLSRARAVFQEMQRQYASGNYAKYGELLQQLEKLLKPSEEAHRNCLSATQGGKSDARLPRRLTLLLAALPGWLRSLSAGRSNACAR
jgi:uncharacterized membrane protein (UPF0182 family)